MLQMAPLLPEQAGSRRLRRPRLQRPGFGWPECSSDGFELRPYSAGLDGSH